MAGEDNHSSGDGPEGGAAGAQGQGAPSRPHHGGARPKIFLPPPSPETTSETEEDEASSSAATASALRGGRSRNEPSLGSSLTSADLPKSFYPVLDPGSDSDTGGGAGLGVSGAGQSNLTPEVDAALRQNERQRRRKRSQGGEEEHDNVNNLNHLQENAAVAALNEDFLEMDLVEDSDLDSGRGDDENVTEANSNNNEDEEEEGEETGAKGEAVAKPEESESEAVAEESEEPQGAAALPGPKRLSLVLKRKVGNSSVPVVTPVREDLGPMVRSRSLNSPLVTSQCLASENREASGLTRDSCVQRLLQREAILFSEAEVLQKLRQRREALPPEAPVPVLALSPSEAEAEAEEEFSETTMVWSQLEACQRQVTQVGTSACGATAVINTLLALEVPHSLEAVLRAVKTRLREEAAPVPRYLFSRSVAGTTHLDLIHALDAVSEGALVSRFFCMHPRRDFALSQWLSSWMKKGAVGIATLNRQRGLWPGQQMPDAWHHQMIFGVSPGGLYLTNPLERVNERTLLEQLSSPSELLVRRSDVLSRYDAFDCDLAELARHPDERWDWFNVLGQVVHLLRHADSAGGGGGSSGPRPRPGPAEHVRIPAAYQAGITLAIRADSEHARELRESGDLPLLTAAKRRC